MFMTWRGFRRGALATVAGWIPFLLAISVLVFALWREPDRIALVIGVVVATAIFILGVMALRSWRRWLTQRNHTPSTERSPRRWLKSCDHVIGAALGLLCSAITCLGLSCLISTLPFFYSVRAQSSVVQETANDPPKWLASVSETCQALAEFADISVLSHVPRLREYGSEVRALVTILNSPPEDLKRLADKHGITELAELPAVKAVLDDHHFINLIQRVRKGSFTALSELVDSPITHELIECPEIRDLSRKLTPSSLARDLKLEARN
jgi:hypothetical protein